MGHDLPRPLWPAIIDAIDYSAKYLVENSGEGAVARTLIVITDGEDGTSGKKIEEIMPFLKEKQIKVFAIGISDLKVSTKLLDRLTKETGGRTFVPRTSAEISNSIIDIVKSLRQVSAPAK
jgi:Mg-chelatase subunit ChlD